MSSSSWSVLAIGIYNSLVQKRLRIDEAFAQIEVQLKRRHDLIPNLVNAVKGYMGFDAAGQAARFAPVRIRRAQSTAVSGSAPGQVEDARRARARDVRRWRLGQSLPAAAATRFERFRRSSSARSRPTCGASSAWPAR